MSITPHPPIPNPNPTLTTQLHLLTQTIHQIHLQTKTSQQNFFAKIHAEDHLLLNHSRNYRLARARQTVIDCDLQFRILEDEIADAKERRRRGLVNMNSLVSSMTLFEEDQLLIQHQQPKKEMDNDSILYKEKGFKISRHPSLQTITQLDSQIVSSPSLDSFFAQNKLSSVCLSSDTLSSSASSDSENAYFELVKFQEEVCAKKEARRMVRDERRGLEIKRLREDVGRITKLND